MVKKISQYILMAIYKLKNEEKHGLLVFNTNTKALVIQKDSCLNLPIDLSFQSLETVSFSNPKLKTITLIFNGKTEKEECGSSEEDDYFSKNYLAQVVIYKNIETNDSQLTTHEIENNDNKADEQSLIRSITQLSKDYIGIWFKNNEYLFYHMQDIGEDLTKTNADKAEFRIKNVDFGM